ncbi:DUF2911 domain-containing protein [Reichenbachiella sp.]|uniref:DUF2911 domain-containing protein n=1 Tax=Reichenbachiella sp. TaxID=2184521 RepID=UPI00329A412E
MKKVVLMTLMLSIGSLLVNAQDVQNSRRISQSTSIARTVGTTEITIVYHSPTAQGRKIFGGIVPFDFVVDGKEYAWRAGSNQRTTIEFQHNVKINKQKISAGKYGLVVLVNELEWTFVFSSNTSWGAFQYTPENDVLRVPVETEKKPHQEWLSYRFVDPQIEAANIELRWADTSAKFTVEVDVTSNIISDLNKKESKSTSDFRILAIENLRKDPEAVEMALDYLDSAMAKIDSVEERLQPYEKFSTNILKADLLIQKGEVREGENLKKLTIENSQGFAMYYYGLNTLIVKGDKKEAYRLLSNNIKSNPDQWQGYLSMGEYYLKDGNQKKVVENFKKSFELAPDNWKNYARYLYLQNKLVLERM